MILLNPNNYILLGYRLSQTKNKKYDAILKNKTNDNIKYIPFGDKNYKHYFDKLGHYSYLNHYDKERKRLYNIRHSLDRINKYSSGWFASKILWA